MSPLSLAFIGDAVYEVMARGRVLGGGNRPVNDLHRETVAFVCAHAQSIAYDALLPVLTQREAEILRRGRNSSSVKPPKNSTVIEYRRATAVEALLGYVYLSGDRGRLEELAEVIFSAIAGREESGDGKAHGQGG